MNRLAACLVCVATALPATADAADPVAELPTTFLGRLLADIHARVDAHVIARPPKLVPPKPVKLGWNLTKLASLDLGAPLVTLTAADLDGDGKGELYAVTPREVIAIAVDRTKVRELGRVAFAGDANPTPPRDVVATAVADGNVLVATVSGFKQGLRVSWQSGALTAAPADAGFVQCAGEILQLAPGRNYFGDAATGTYATRCTRNLVDSDGYPLRARAVLSLANKLDIAVERCAATNLGCQPTARHEYANAGIAFEVADVDRDGKPELLYAGAGPPGDADALKIVTLGDDEKKAKLRKAFTAGGVAGIAVTDLDGNGTPDAVAAVRLVGVPRVDLWRLE